MRTSISLLFSIFSFLFSIKVFASNKVVQIDNISYIISEDEQYAKVAYRENGYSGHIFIPDTVNYDGKSYPVTKINDFTFYNCQDLLSVRIPNGISCIEEGTFFMCHNLKKVTCDISEVITIKQRAFAECFLLKEIPRFEKLKSIGDVAFAKCTSLKRFFLSRNVVSVGTAAFKDCVNLVGVDMSESKFIISDGLFKNCYMLREIDIHSCYGKIGDCAFENCFQLPDIKIPEEVTSIGTQSFKYCLSFKNIRIPGKITEIGVEAFAFCNSIDNVVFEGDNFPVLRARTFLAPPSTSRCTITIYVKENLLKKCDKIIYRTVAEKHLNLQKINAIFPLDVDADSICHC